MTIFNVHASQGVLLAVNVNGSDVCVRSGSSAAAAALLAGVEATRISPVDQSPRAPYCMMGVCFECLMTIDGEPNQQGCMINVRAGMIIECLGQVRERA